MTAGDVLEWLAGGGLTYAAWLATHKSWATILVGCVFLAYQAQCWATQPLGRHRKPANGTRQPTRGPRHYTLKERLTGAQIKVRLIPARARARYRYWRASHQPQTVKPPRVHNPDPAELMAGLEDVYPPAADSPVTTEV